MQNLLHQQLFMSVEPNINKTQENKNKRKRKENKRVARKLVSLTFYVQIMTINSLNEMNKQHSHRT